MRSGDDEFPVFMGFNVGEIERQVSKTKSNSQVCIFQRIGTKCIGVGVFMCIPRSWAPNLRWFRPGVPFGRMDRLEDLKRRGWVAPSLAFFDGLDMEKVKEILGPICSEWGLEDFAALREEAGRQKRMVDAEDVNASREPSSSHRDVTWKPGEGS